MGRCRRDGQVLQAREPQIKSHASFFSLPGPEHRAQEEIYSLNPRPRELPTVPTHHPQEKISFDPHTATATRAADRPNTPSAATTRPPRQGHRPMYNNIQGPHSVHCSSNPLYNIQGKHPKQGSVHGLPMSKIQFMAFPAAASSSRSCAATDGSASSCAASAASTPSLPSGEARTCDARRVARGV